MNPQARILEARKFSKASWIVFGTGILAIVALLLVRIDIVYSNWGWNKSYFAQHCFWPFLMDAFACYVVAPFFSRAPVGRVGAGLS
jgi:ABC-type arginine/histidine transport system permease subunit